MKGGYYMAAGQPKYFKITREMFESINAALPKAQAAKLLYAICMHHFEGVDPEGGWLSKQAQLLYFAIINAEKQKHA